MGSAETTLRPDTNSPFLNVSEARQTNQKLTPVMDDAWVEHVTAILDYLDGRTQSPDAQACQSARDLIASLSAWAFIGSTSHYGLQVRALEILQRLAYHDVDRGAIRDIASWVLEQWLRLLQRYPRSVPALRGKWVL